jgi:hypothetical protein
MGSGYSDMEVLSEYPERSLLPFFLVSSTEL